MPRVLPDTARMPADPRASAACHPHTHLAHSCGAGAERPGPDPTRSAPDAGVPRRGSLHRGIMADDEEMEVEKDSKEGPRFVVKKWCGSRPVPGWLPAVATARPEAWRLSPVSLAWTGTP